MQESIWGLEVHTQVLKIAFLDTAQPVLSHSVFWPVEVNGFAPVMLLGDSTLQNSGAGRSDGRRACQPAGL